MRSSVILCAAVAAVGRARSQRGTEVAAVFYSLIESAKLAGVDPAKYLRAAAEAALDDREPPLPREFANAPVPTPEPVAPCW